MSVGSVNIIREGLILCLDGENLKSYPGSGDNWYDLTSNSNNGLLTNGATFSPSGNGSISFDGVNDYISCGNSSTFQINTATLCVWMKTTNPGNGYRAIITKQSNYGLFLLDGVLITYDWGDGTYGTARSTGINLTDGKWYHVVLSFTNNIMSPSNNADIYINGVNVLTTTIEYKNDSQEVQIVSGGSIGGSQYLNGNIASVQIYNRSLTSSEVLQNYNSIKWRFMNESEVLPSIVTDQLVLNLDPSDPSSYPGSGTNWYDLTAYNNDGVLTNGVVYNNSLYGGGMDFDGINDYVTIPSSTSLNPTHTITLCAWVNYNGVYSGYSAPIVFKRNTQMNYFEQYIFGFSTSGKIGLALGDDANTNDFTETTSSYINQLINVVGIIDTLNSVMKIYINGILESSKIITYPNMYISTNPVIIGSYNEPSFNGFMGGGIYNVLIYGKALSEEEILQNYNVQKSRYGL